MELYFMAVAILILTLIAAFAIRRAEEEIVEHREFDRRERNGPPKPMNDETTSGTNARA
jgi:hypothetical protein